jgi:acetyltransferase-like isoleucine patch superfamily enzyme
MVKIPPFYTTGGVDISVGRNVFINQNCTFYDLGGLDIADEAKTLLLRQAL